MQTTCTNNFPMIYLWITNQYYKSVDDHINVYRYGFVLYEIIGEIYLCMRFLVYGIY